MNYIAKNTSLQLGTQAVIDEQRNFVTTAILLHISALWFSHIASILADSCVNRASCINIVRCLHSIWACLATVCVIVLYRLPDKLCGVVVGRDDHYPVCRLDIQKDSEFATGYGYPKSAFNREPDTDI